MDKMKIPKTSNDKQMEDAIPKQVLSVIVQRPQALPMQVLNCQELWKVQKHSLYVKVASNLPQFCRLWQKM